MNEFNLYVNPVTGEAICRTIRFGPSLRLVAHNERERLICVRIKGGAYYSDRISGSHYARGSFDVFRYVTVVNDSAVIRDHPQLFTVRYPSLMSAPLR